MLGSGEFQQWVSKEKQTLFCPGIPGAGKTIMSSIVVDHLTTKFPNNDVSIEYIYCNYQPRKEQKLEDILLSLLKKLAQGQPTISPDIKSLYERHQTRGNRPQLDEITKTLHSTARKYSRVFAIIDALDEYHNTNNQGTDELISELFRFQEQAQNINLFLTSRPIPQIMSKFERCTSKEIRAQDDDILSYINGQIPKLLPLNGVKKPEVQDTIRKKIMKAADGMFLLARLHMDSLRSQLTVGHIKRVLQNLPQGQQRLGETYKKAMDRIEAQEEANRTLAKRLLSWLTYARTALSPDAVAHALAVDWGMVEMDDDFNDFIPDVETLGSICAGLVIVDKHSNPIRLVHYTTQEFLKSQLPNAERKIAVTCVTYLSFNRFAAGLCSIPEKFNIRLKENPLYEYAA
ncbi:hypothetical protein VTN96DRAFT_9217 [Rasamsonia emersonii]